MALRIFVGTYRPHFVTNNNIVKKDAIRFGLVNDNLVGF